MKRAGITIAFLLVGLLTTWLACLAGSHMSFRLPIGVSLRHSNGCYEIGECSVPWWAVLGFLAYILGPSTVFGVAGWFAGRMGVTPRRAMLQLLALIVLTTFLYLTAYALERR